MIILTCSHPLTCTSTPPSKKHDHTKPAVSSRRVLFFASSVNVRSKVHFEIMEHVTFFSASRRYCSRGIGAFWMRGCAGGVRGGGSKALREKKKCHSHYQSRALAWTSTFPCVRFGRKKAAPGLWLQIREQKQLTGFE